MSHQTFYVYNIQERQRTKGIISRTVEKSLAELKGAVLPSGANAWLICETGPSQ